MLIKILFFSRFAFDECMRAVKAGSDVFTATIIIISTEPKVIVETVI